MKRAALFIIFVLSLMAFSASAQEEAPALPQILQTHILYAESATWTAVDVTTGTLMLVGIDGRQQIINSTDPLLTAQVDSFYFASVWALIPDAPVAEATLSAYPYQIRLSLSVPVVDEENATISYTAQVIEMVNFEDETTKDMPTALEFPTLILQTDGAFMNAWLVADAGQSEGTRTATNCTQIKADMDWRWNRMYEISRLQPNVTSEQQQEYAILNGEWTALNNQYNQSCVKKSGSGGSRAAAH